MKFRFKAYNRVNDSTGDERRKVPNRPGDRREQLRRAQKTHRERKEAYIKSLEAEVLQLRANEASIRQETKNLYGKISSLKALLAENGIPVPASDGPLPPPKDATPPSGKAADASLSVATREDLSRDGSEQTSAKNEATETRAQGIYSMPSVSTPASGSKEQTRKIQTVNYSRQVRNGSLDICPAHHAPVAAHGARSRRPAYNLFPTKSPSIRLGELDSTSLGMDFVLTAEPVACNCSLERPCLDHLRSLREENAPSNGHALTASALLLHQSPVRSVWDLNWDHIGQVPGSTLERLLELSSSLRLNGEVTPVQAWDYVRRHPQYKGLEVSRLRDLIEKLLKYVKCFGFGGVIEQGVFENSVFEAYVVGRVF